MHLSHSLGMITVCGIGGRVGQISFAYGEGVFNGNGQSRAMSNLRRDRRSIGIATAIYTLNLGSTKSAWRIKEQLTLLWVIAGGTSTVNNSASGHCIANVVL